ncbi:MAG: hypothetical protein K8823_562 [Cenarchaeum symbiont of Oopsacas minuta]|nr:hypothetical protein [Cenarchaeum symbiont of Oopsacas minuta]
MSAPVETKNGGICIRPEKMKTEKLYHCILKEKIMLVYKDNQGMFNCYEIEDSDLVKIIQNCTNDEQVEKTLHEFANTSTSFLHK